MATDRKKISACCAYFAQKILIQSNFFSIYWHFDSLGILFRSVDTNNIDLLTFIFDSLKRIFRLLALIFLIFFDCLKPFFDRLTLFFDPLDNYFRPDDTFNFRFVNLSYRFVDIFFFRPVEIFFRLVVTIFPTRRHYISIWWYFFSIRLHYFFPTFDSYCFG